MLLVICLEIILGWIRQSAGSYILHSIKYNFHLALQIFPYCCELSRKFCSDMERLEHKLEVCNSNFDWMFNTCVVLIFLHFYSLYLIQSPEGSAIFFLFIFFILISFFLIIWDSETWNVKCHKATNTSSPISHNDIRHSVMIERCWSNDLKFSVPYLLASSIF